MELSKHDREILAALDEGCGRTTKRVSENVTSFGCNARQHSVAVRSWLMILLKAGLVQYLDDLKPVCRERTPAGTTALREEERIEAAYKGIHKDALKRSFIR